jgi:CofH subfamily radical SAM domain protein
MCSFYAKPGWKSALFLSPEQVEEKVKTHRDQNLNEIHVVGGLWKEANLDYYQDMFTRIKKIDPQLHIKAMTPVEYDYLAHLHGITVEEVFHQMMQWGLGSLPGGGAEILVEEIRKQVAPQKISSDRYLEIHEIAHSLGLHSNMTMLYGHVEDPIHIITHLDKVRKLQDKTSGLRTFVPLKYHLENNALGKRQQRIKPKPFQRIYAISRLMLDNIPHLKVLWNYLGIEDALEALRWGGNDLGSTALDEKIIRMAGGVDVAMSDQGMQSLISGLGRTPLRCHSGELT